MAEIAGPRMKDLHASQSYKSFCSVLSLQVPPAFPLGPLSPVSSPHYVLQAAQPSRNPSQQLPLPHPSTPCLSRDQVLRVLAKNEMQLSLLRDLEGLKPQKVRTAQGLGTCSPFSHSCLHLWLPPSPRASNLLSDGSAKDHRTMEKSTVAPLQGRLGALA